MSTSARLNCCNYYSSCRQGSKDWTETASLSAVLAVRGFSGTKNMSGKMDSYYHVINAILN